MHKLLKILYYILYLTTNIWCILIEVYLFDARHHSVVLTISSTGIFSVDCPLPATASSSSNSSNSSSNQQQPAAATAPAPSRPLHIRLSVAITVDATRLRRCNRRSHSRVIVAVEVGLEVHCPPNLFFWFISTIIEILARLPLFHRPPPIPFGCRVERLRRVLRWRVASLFCSSVGIGA